MSKIRRPEEPDIEWFVSGTINRRKLDEYVLSATHREGKHKFRLWRGIFGFEEEQGELLERLIREQLPQVDRIVEKEPALDQEDPSVSYRRFELVIPRFRGPNNNVGPILTSWALDPGADRPHLTSAYPRKTRGRRS